ncbi:MAG TPA: hypothetical protein VF054_03215 [Micromonosporaceae bacterium]
MSGATSVEDRGYASKEAFQEAPPAPTGWVGWIVFGAVVLILVGIFQFIEGLVAVVNSGWYAVGANGLTVNVDYTAWGWTHMAIGVLAAISGFGILVAQTWARVIGVVLASISAIVNLAFMPAYPLWSLLVIALDVVVIYALVAHGREMSST